MNSQTAYTILPFHFTHLPDHELLLVNAVGEYLFVKTQDFSKLLDYKLPSNSDIFLNLKGKHFIADTDIPSAVDMLAIKYRSKKAFLKNFTALHMMVITARCNCECRYCHASCESVEKSRWDMTPSIAKEAVEIIFQTPSPIVKIEFQGGEPLLNWEVIQTTIEHAEIINKNYKKNLEFVLCTNLTLLTEEILKYLHEHNVYISTSLDGPRDLHDRNRILRKGGSTHELFIEKLNLARSIAGKDKVSALMTATKYSLSRFRSIVDEYIRNELNGVFFRSLNPFGFAKAEQAELGYDIEDFLRAYKDALTYIIEVNLNGVFFVEHYASLFLSRILTPFSTGFMDLQFPAGVGITGAIYDYDGGVYPSDEARMLAKTGDRKFLLGNVTRNSYLDIFYNPLLHDMIKKSCAEILPGCTSCAYQIYCGSDPIRNYSEQGNLIGHRPTSDFCKLNMGIIEYLFEFLRSDNDDVMDVFWSWITHRPLENKIGN